MTQSQTGTIRDSDLPGTWNTKHTHLWIYLIWLAYSGRIISKLKQEGKRKRWKHAHLQSIRASHFNRKSNLIEFCIFSINWNFNGWSECDTSVAWSVHHFSFTTQKPLIFGCIDVELIEFEMQIYEMMVNDILNKYHIIRRQFLKHFILFRVISHNTDFFFYLEKQRTSYQNFGNTG